MKKLNIEVIRGRNSSVGNPSFIIKKWDDNELMNELLDKKSFKEFNNKKDGRGIKTRSNAGFAYSLLNKNGPVIDGILVIATLYVEK